MKICLVSQEYPPDTARGGIGTQTWNKAHALARLSHDVHVLSCAAAGGPDLASEMSNGVTLHRMQPPGEEKGQNFPIYNPATYSLGYSWNVFRHLHRLMRSVEFDVIDFPEYGAEGFAYQLDRSPWNWVPVVVQLHAPLAMLSERMRWPEKDSDLYRVGTFLEGSSIEHADALMACSSNIAEFTANFYDISPARIDVVHCGVDSQAFRPVPESKDFTKRPTVLFVGNIAANKGIHTALAAVLRLRSKYPAVRLQVLGTGDEDMRSALQQCVSIAGAQSNVEFHGFVDRLRLPEFYQRATVFCSPAQHEGGVANVYLEAMACGCPVVASVSGGAPEAVTHGETGLLVPPGDVGAVEAALDLILGNENLAGKMGRAGRRRVDEYFAMDKYISRVLRNYVRAIDCSRKKLKSINVGATKETECA
jgi:glycosyltransferase involved in cell wall biosynthesis